MESDVFVWIPTDKMEEHGTKKDSESIRIKKCLAYVAICAFSQPARTARYVMYVSAGELRIAHPTKRRLYIATMVACSGSWRKESLTNTGENRIENLQDRDSIKETDHQFPTKMSGATDRELVANAQLLRSRM